MSQQASTYFRMNDSQRYFHWRCRSGLDPIYPNIQTAEDILNSNMEYEIPSAIYPSDIQISDCSRQLKLSLLNGSNSLESLAFSFIDSCVMHIDNLDTYGDIISKKLNKEFVFVNTFTGFIENNHKIRSPVKYGNVDLIQLDINIQKIENNKSAIEPTFHILDFPPSKEFQLYNEQVSTFLSFKPYMISIDINQNNDNVQIEMIKYLLSNIPSSTVVMVTDDKFMQSKLSQLSPFCYSKNSKLYVYNSSCNLVFN